MRVQFQHERTARASVSPPNLGSGNYGVQSSTRRLELDVRADLEHPVGRDVVRACDGGRVLVQEGEEALAPAGHSRPAGREDRDVVDVVGGAVEVDVEPLALGLLEGGDDVRLVLVAVAGGDRDEAQAELLDGDPLGIVDVGHADGVDLHEDDVLMDDAVVLGVVEQSGGHRVERRRQEDGTARDAIGPLVDHPVDVPAQRHAILLHRTGQRQPALVPRREDDEEDRPDDEREPPAAHDLRHVRREERELDGDEERRARHHDPQRLSPQDPEDDEREQRVGGKDGAEGDPVGVRKPRRRAEREDEHDDRREQEPVHDRDVDLPDDALRRVADAHPRQEPELDHLLGHRERARDDGLGRDHRRDRREHDHRLLPRLASGDEEEEWVGDGVGTREDERALAHVVQEQGTGRPGRARPG